MSLFCAKTQDLSWQDRTITIEVMMAPGRSQLLFNKHKGLRTKFQQANENLEREKSAYLKGHKIEQRLMERRKDLYSKRRNDIILRRSSGDSRKRGGGASDHGRSSAPPRLEVNTEGESVFLTQINQRGSKSADPRTKLNSLPASQPLLRSSTTHLFPNSKPEVNSGVSPDVSSRTTVPGKPFLERGKNVRFNNTKLGERSVLSPTPAKDLTIDGRIERFMSEQDDFNNRKLMSTLSGDEDFRPDKKSLQRRRISFHMNMSKLESAFDEFCATNSSTEGLQKLVKFASKMKAHVRTASRSTAVPEMATIQRHTALTGVS